MSNLQVTPDGYTALSQEALPQKFKLVSGSNSHWGISGSITLTLDTTSTILWLSADIPNDLYGVGVAGKKWMRLNKADTVVGQHCVSRSMQYCVKEPYVPSPGNRGFSWAFYYSSDPTQVIVGHNSPTDTEGLFVQHTAGTIQTRNVGFGARVLVDSGDKLKVRDVAAADATNFTIVEATSEEDTGITSVQTAYQQRLASGIPFVDLLRGAQLANPSGKLSLLRTKALTSRYNYIPVVRLSWVFAGGASGVIFSWTDSNGHSRISPLVHDTHYDFNYGIAFGMTLIVSYTLYDIQGDQLGASSSVTIQAPAAATFTQETTPQLVALVAPNSVQYVNRQATNTALSQLAQDGTVAVLGIEATDI